MAPMSLVTYEDARPWARSIKRASAARQMPPWHIDKTVGIQEFKNDRSLSDDQIDTIAQWVDAGAPKGDPKDMPPAESVAGRSSAGTSRSCSAARPDLIVTSPPFTQKAGATTGRVDKPVDDDRPHRSRAGCARSKFVPPPSRAARSRITRSPGCRRTMQPITLAAESDVDDSGVNAGPGPSWNGPSASRARSCARTPAS